MYVSGFVVIYFDANIVLALLAYSMDALEKLANKDM
jgi:hypothetical protein